MGLLPALALSAVTVAVAAGIRLLLGLIGPTLAFATFFPAILVSSLIGGRLPGLLSIPMSILVVWYIFIDPPFAITPLTGVIAANFLVFALSSLFIVWLAHLHRQLVFEFEDIQAERELLAREMIHRSKNQLAVTLSLIRRTVRDKEEADKLIDRLLVSASDDDLFEGTVGQPATLSGLIEQIVKKRYPDQIKMSGEMVPLTADMARCFGIAFHEMTTNAVKYGSLSSNTGIVKIEWIWSGGRLEIDWTEIDGPKPLPGRPPGFGSTLMAKMFQNIRAHHEMNLRETGCSHHISLELMKDAPTTQRVSIPHEP